MSSRIANLVKHFLICRSIWNRTNETVPRKDQLFVPFYTWILTIRASQTVATPTEVTDLLNAILRNGSQSPHHEIYSNTDLNNKLRINAHGQYYRIALAADCELHETDYRVRDFINAAIERSDWFRLDAVVCGFFTDLGTPKTQSLAKGPLRTEPCTRFEQLVFLSAIAHLSKMLEAGRRTKSKKRKLSDGNATTDKAFLAKVSPSTLKQHSQRIGKTIQGITRAWDAFAVYLGFESIENMVLPYVRVSSALQFEVISKRTDGFAPFIQLQHIHVDAEPTQETEDTFEGVADRPHELDNAIRIFAEDFFADVRNAISSTDLYTCSTNSEWGHMKRFKIPSRGVLPSRFELLSSALIHTIRSTMPQPTADDAMEDIDVDATPSSHLKTKPRSCSQPADDYTIADLADITDEEMKQKWAIMEKEIKPHLRMHNCPFEEFVEVDDLFGVQSPIVGNVQLLLTDPPFNIRRLAGYKNAQYDVLTEDQMKMVVENADSLLRPGGHAIIYCSIQQFKDWEVYFTSHTTQVDSKTVRPTFDVDPVPIVFTKHLSARNGASNRSSNTLSSIAEFAVHLTKRGPSQAEKRSMVNYKNFNYVASTYPAYRNVIDNCKGLLPSESIRVQKSDNSGTANLRSEQKPLSVLKELISRFSQPGDIVVDLFSGTFATALACFDIPEHRQFVGCEKDNNCYSHATKHVFKCISRIISERKTDMHFSPALLDAALYVNNYDKNFRMPSDPGWKSPKDMPQYQILPQHLLAHLAAEWKNAEFFVRCLNKPVHKWTREFRGMLEQTDPKTLMITDYTNAGVFLAPSTIKHERAGMGVFASRTFAKGDRICSFFGTLVYHDLSLRGHVVHKTYGEGILGVTAKRFTAYSIQIMISGNAFSHIKGSSQGKKPIFIVPAPFCVAGYINDMRYHPNDEEYDLYLDNARDKTIGNIRKANARFTQSTPVHHPSQLTDTDLIHIEANELINPGAEIFIYYGDTSPFVHE